MASSAHPVRAVPSLLTNTTPWRAFPHTPLTLSNPKAKYCSSLRLPLPYPPLLSHIRSRRTITSLLLLPAQGTALLPRATYSSHARPPPPSPHDIIFSADQPADLPHRALKLFPDWQLTGSRKGVVRQFTFSSFTKAWRFMSLIADECKAKNHHPSWSNLYNRVTIEWTTHSPNGLSTKDVEMAEFCNQKAAEIGLKQ